MAREAGGGAGGGGGVRGDQDKHFLLLEPGQAGGGTGDWGDAFMKGLAAGGGVRDRDRKAETQGHGGGTQRRRDGGP